VGNRNSWQLKLELEAKLWLGPCTGGGVDGERRLAAALQRERGGNRITREINGRQKHRGLEVKQSSEMRLF